MTMSLDWSAVWAVWRLRTVDERIDSNQREAVSTVCMSALFAHVCDNTESVP